ncbi:MAG: RecQ family ATP-dependent DNA helicase [Prevotella sp.]|nr:RecQ family ATP-dependent DNA helicase [Prevotella sp.]
MNYELILKQYWGYDSFRGVQKEIIESILAGKDTLGLMPTGGGKSLCFQVPAMALPGLTIVITPLIALMKDQVDHLRHQGVNATAIYSGMSREEIAIVLDNCILGSVKLLYISPERLASDLFQNKVRKMNISFITVDEAHCISQWGYDFRPAYLEIAKIRALLTTQHPSPNTSSSPHKGGQERSPIPILALTATATPLVVDDIQDRLLFSEKNVIGMSFARENLAYVVRHTDDKLSELVHILKAIPQSAIVYVRSRKRSKEIAEFLNDKISPDTHGTQKIATFYHAGLEPAIKDNRQESWQNDEVRIMVATNAFGMGIDKADVRIVIHMDSPSSLEAYFQEAGRAGRDGKKAYAVLLHSNNDDSRLRKRIIDTYPPKEFIREIYNQLAYFYQIALGYGYGETHEFSIERFCTAYRHFPTHVEAALSILSQAGYISYDADPNNAARLRFLIDRNELYRLQEGSKYETAVITALLRAYGGLFVDYCFIDESRIADITGIDRNILYQTLKGLHDKHIISFIPQRSTPLITFTKSREDGADIIISEEIYEKRREQFKKNIEAVITYTNDNYRCRSQQLLEYFGEKDCEPCHICDVCRAEIGKEPESDATIEDAMNLIMELLADHKAHHVNDIKHLPINSNLIGKALRKLLDEEEVYMDGSSVIKC